MGQLSSSFSWSRQKSVLLRTSRRSVSILTFAVLMLIAMSGLPSPPPSSYEILEEARNATSPADLQRDFSKHCSAAKEALLLAEHARDRVQAKFPDWRVTVDSSCGSAAWELVAKAAR